MHDELTQLCEAEFAQHVDKLFDREVRQVLARGDAIGLTPVLETIFDATDKASIAKAKGEGCRALAACEWHRKCAPRWAEKLPISQTDLNKNWRELSPQQMLLLGFGSSLQFLGWHYNQHPPFPIYAAGVLAYDFAPDELRNDLELIKEFRPRPLAGIDRFLRYNTPAMIAHQRHELLRALQDRHRNGGGPPLRELSINQRAHHFLCISTGAR